jgi:hypothetical protein
VPNRIVTLSDGRVVNDEIGITAGSCPHEAVLANRCADRVARNPQHAHEISVRRAGGRCRSRPISGVRGFSQSFQMMLTREARTVMAAISPHGKSSRY